MARVAEKAVAMEVAAKAAVVMVVVAMAVVVMAAEVKVVVERASRRAKRSESRLSAMCVGRPAAQR